MRIAKIETLKADAGWRDFSFLKLTTDVYLPLTFSSRTEPPSSPSLSAPREVPP